MMPRVLTAGTATQVRNVWIEKIEDGGEAAPINVFVAEVSKMDEHKSVTHVTIVERVKKKRKQ